MKMLTSEITKLLDKLYNLRGEDSVILTKMEKEREEAEETKTRTEKEKTNLQERIENLSEEEKVLSEEGDRLVTALNKIKTEDYKNVLDKLNLDFDPSELSKEIDYLLPKTIRKVQKEINDTKKELVKVEEEMNSSIATIEELAIRKEEALSNQKKLNEYFDLAFKGNSNITRDAVASLLDNFEFSDEEQREAAKILMFPEDALFEYEERIQNGSEVREEKVVVNNIVKEEEFKEIKEDNLSPKDRLVNTLTDLGFDYLDFTTSDVDDLLEHFDEEKLKDNVMFMKNKGVNLDMFVDNAKLLYDNELQEKVEKLISIGKKAKDIYLYPNILSKYNKVDLDNTISKFENSGLDPKMVPLMAY